MLIKAAGWPIWPLICASFVALALIGERLMSLRRERVLPAKLFDEVARMHRAGRVSTEMVSKLEKNSPLGRVLAAGLKHAHGSHDALKEAVEEAGSAAAHDLERYLSALGTVATLAPLMGLFGTVVGMIDIFGSQGAGGSDPAQLAHGISMALYNTAFGLGVAMPALVFYRHFRARVEGYVVEMEQVAIRFVEMARGAGR